MLISFEGIDASGKHTQSRLLHKELLSKRHDVEYISFPDYSTAIGSEIHSFLSGKKDYALEARHMLYAANRYEHKNEIESWLSKEKVVIINRYCDSNLAYGVASGLSHDWLASLESRLPQADYVFFVRITPELSASRKTKRDKFEVDLNFLRRVCSVYDALSERSNWFPIDGTRSIEDISNEIAKLTLALIEKKKEGTI